MDKITIERETLERAVTALVYHQQQTRPIERTQIAIRALRAALAALAAQPAEPVACLIRYRSCTPARVAHDKHVHWHDWSKWDIATLAHGKAVTDPSRNPTEDGEWQMQPLYAAPAAVPPGFDVHDLSDVADGLDVYERTIDVDGNHIESTTAYAARFIRAVLAVAGEKP